MMPTNPAVLPCPAAAAVAMTVSMMALVEAEEVSAGAAKSLCSENLVLASDGG